MRHVLVVDDDDEIRAILFDFLMEEGYQVSLAQNGAQALAVLQREHGLIVLLDLRMPGIDGWAVLDALQAQQQHAHRVVVITAEPFSPRKHYRLTYGMVHAVVQKPFNMDHLLLVVEQLAQPQQRSQ